MSNFERWWERTWRERMEAYELAFGATEPPGMVTSYSWDEPFRLPSACALTYPRAEATQSPSRPARDHWLYVTQGLSQPGDPEEVKAARAAGNDYSGYGVEFAVLTEQKCRWSLDVLYYFLSYQTDGEEIAWGHRFPFGFFQAEDGNWKPYTGSLEKLGQPPVGELRAMLFWPYFSLSTPLLTSTGKFDILVATGITQDEWDAAKATSTAHIVLLLCRAEIGQKTLPQRTSVLRDPRWEHLWQGISKQSEDEVLDQLWCEHKG